MIIVGIVLSMMSSHYITSDAGDDGLIRSRWWWEIVLNSQILCVAFMWFTHIDRIKSAEGGMAIVKGFQLFAALVAILLPVWVALVAIAMDWFKTTPPLDSVHRMIVVALSAWALAWVANLLVTSLLLRKPVRPWFMRIPSWGGRMVCILPLLAAVILVFVEYSRGGQLHYMYCPFLFFLQGAVPYLAKSVRFDGEAQAQAEHL